MGRDQSSTTPASSRRHTATTTNSHLNTMINLGYVALRLERQRFLASADRHFLVVLEEQAELTITQRGEIAVYEKRFRWLQESARFGAQAKGIVHEILADWADEAGE